MRGQEGCLGLGVLRGSLCESSHHRPTGSQDHVTARSQVSIVGDRSSGLEGGGGIPLQCVEGRG